VSTHFDPRSWRVIGASPDGTARVWDIRPPYRRWASQAIGEDCGTDVSLDDDHRFVAVSCASHGTRVWDTARDRLLAALPPVTRVDDAFGAPLPAVSSAGDTAAIARGNAVDVYALPGGRLVRSVQHAAPVTTVRFAGQGHALVTGSADGALLVTRDGAQAIALPRSATAIDVAGFLPDGRVVAADASRRVSVFDLERAVRTGSLVVPSRIRALRTSPDGQRVIGIAGAGSPEPPVLCDLLNGQVIALLEGHKGQVHAAQFVERGQAILTAGADGTVRRWDARTGRIRQIYPRATSSLRDAALSPDGAILVGAGGDGIARFWDASSGTRLWTLPAHRSAIRGVHFEGRDLVTRGDTGDIARWTIPELPAASDLVRRVDQLTRCMPLRVDEGTGGFVPQAPSPGCTAGRGLEHPTILRSVR
jgi:WD40 repeat protein